MKQLFLFYIIISFSLQCLYGQDTTFYYPDGKVSSTGRLVNNLPEGYWKTYYKNGVLRSEGNRVEHKLDGLWVFYDTSGRKEKDIVYNMGLKEGEHTYYKDGMIEKKIPYVKNIRQGISYTFYPTGKISRRDTYANDQIIGVSMLYDTLGVVTSLITYRDGVSEKIQRVNRTDRMGEKQGLWVWFYDDTSMIEHQGIYSRGKKHGVFKYYDRKGRLLRSEKYIDDLLQEKALETSSIEIKRTYYDNGKLKAYESHRMGIKDGISMYYSYDEKIDSVLIYSDGKIVERGTSMTADGLKEGIWETYTSAGEKLSTGSYKAGKEIGEWTYFYPNGNIESKGVYVNGKRDGNWLWYYDNGSVLKEESYMYGKSEGESISYDMSGNIISKGLYEAGERTGDWYFINGDTRDYGRYMEGKKEGEWRMEDIKTGKIVFKCIYREGSMNGVCNFYYTDGRKRADGYFIDNKRSGKWTFYDEKSNVITVVEYN